MQPPGNFDVFALHIPPTSTFDNREQFSDQFAYLGLTLLSCVNFATLWLTLLALVNFANSG